MRDIRGGRIAMIFQEPMTSLSPRPYRRRPGHGGAAPPPEGRPQERGRAAVKLFERVGFQNPVRKLKTYPFELSGGMRQRAMIAMALICKPALLIADEPTTALDVTTQAQILALIKDVQAEMGMTVMLITHDLGIVANMADDVLVMYRGAVMERGRLETIFLNPRHPYLKALIRAVPRFDMPENGAPRAAPGDQGLRRGDLRQRPLRRNACGSADPHGPRRRGRDENVHAEKRHVVGQSPEGAGAEPRQPVDPRRPDRRPRG